MIDFRTATSLEHLAVQLGCSQHLLHAVVTAPKRETFYVQIKIPKRNSRRKKHTRTVWYVHFRQLADVHRSFARRFHVFAGDALPEYPHPCVHGYMPGRSIVTNASQHSGAKLLLRADIREFFPSISKSRIEALFSRMNLDERIIPSLAALVTIKDALPLGLSASPLLANLICLDLDAKFKQLADRYSCIYTRYADDVSISGEEQLPTRSEITEILSGEGFSLSRSKFRTTKRGQAHYVTGLSISDTRPRLPRSMKRRVRQELYYCEKWGVLEHFRTTDEFAQAGVNRLDGTLRYFNGIEPDFASPLRTRWNNLLDSAKLEITYAPRHNQAIRNIDLYIDETTLETSAGYILALGCVALERPNSLASDLKSLSESYLADPFASGRKTKLATVGLHYSDATQELRTDVVRFLATVPFRAYVVYDLLPKGRYKETYLSLMKDLLLYRMMKFDQSRMKVCAEVNPHVTLRDASELVGSVYAGLKLANKRRPLSSPDFRWGQKKADPELSMTDAVLGVFADYAISNMRPEMRGISEKQFERLRERYRLIFSKNRKVWFTRKRPFCPWPDGNPQS